MPTKFKTSILIFGIIVMCLLASLATFLVLASSGVLLTEKAKLEITVQSATKVYDGTPLTANEYKIEGELADGHKEAVIFTDSQTDAGEGQSGAEVRVMDEDGYDVTSMYAIKVNKGVLRVTRQTLSVAIADTEVVYSGDRIIFDDYLLQRGTLAKGHKIGAATAVGVIKPGVVDSTTLKPAVYDAFGNDVTKNYDIAFAMGTVQVIPRPLVVRPRSETKVYDGKALLASRIEIASGSLIAGHEIRATEFQTASGETAQLTEAGTLPVYVKAYSIYDAKGENVSEYYKVSNDLGNPGILEVTQRELTVVGKSKAWEYDGKPHSFTSTAGREDTETSAEMALGLAEGHSVVIDYSALRDNSITDTGSKPCRISSENVKVLDASGTDKSRNYQITYVNGTLTITPQNLRITVKDYTVEYNDTAIPQATLKEQLVLFAPFEADDFELILSDEEYKNAGVYSLSAKPYVNENPKTEQEAQDEAVRRELFKNYKIDIIPGTVTITKKAISITVNSFSREYSGQEITDETILSNVNCPDWFDENSLEVEKDGQKYVNAGTYRVSVKFKEGTDPVKGDFDSDNYMLSIVPGTLTITRKKVGVMVADLTSEYNSTLSNEQLQNLIVCGSNEFQASDFKVTGIPEGTLTVGTYVLGAEIIETAANREKLVNYEPSITLGKLTVNKKKVKVEVTNGEAVYSQTPNAHDATLQSLLHCTDAAIGQNATEINNALMPDVKGECVNTGTYIVSAKLRDTVSSEIKNNIELDVAVGSFTIRPQTITVTMKDNTSEFTGQGVQLTQVPAPDTETGISLKILSSTIEGVKNAGTYSYTAEMVVLAGEGESATVNPNYTVRSLAGTWTITPIVLTAIQGSREKVYDGKPIEINVSELSVELGENDDYSVISVEYDKTDLKAYVGGILDLKNIRIRDNVTGQECFNYMLTGSFDLTVTQRTLNISVGSITVSKGTSADTISNMLMMGGVQYTLFGLADGDIAEVTFFASEIEGQGIKILPSIDDIVDQNGTSVKNMYDLSAVDDAMGLVFVI